MSQARTKSGPQDSDAQTCVSAELHSTGNRRPFLLLFRVPLLDVLGVAMQHRFDGALWRIRVRNVLAHYFLWA